MPTAHHSAIKTQLGALSETLAAAERDGAFGANLVLIRLSVSRAQYWFAQEWGGIQTEAKDQLLKLPSPVPN